MSAKTCPASIWSGVVLRTAFEHLLGRLIVAGEAIGAGQVHAIAGLGLVDGNRLFEQVDGLGVVPAIEGVGALGGEVLGLGFILLLGGRRLRY